MTGCDVLRRRLAARFPGATVSVVVSDDGRYEITVLWDGFGARNRSDREAIVYDALRTLPLGLVAKVITIDARVA